MEGKQGDFHSIAICYVAGNGSGRLTVFDAASVLY